MQYGRWLGVFALSAFLVGCGGSPYVLKTYDPQTDARIRVSMVSKFWRIYFNQPCVVRSWQPGDLDFQDLAYRWDFGPDKKVGMPAGMKSPYDEFIIKAGVPILVDINLHGATTVVDGYTRDVYIDDAVALTPEPGSDYEAYLNTFGKIVVRRIWYVDGQLKTETPAISRPKQCPRYKREYKLQP